MTLIPPNPTYICRRCVQSLRPHRSAFSTRPQLRPSSTDASTSVIAPRHTDAASSASLRDHLNACGSRIRIKRFMTVGRAEIDGQSQQQHNPTSTRPPGRIRPNRPRRAVSMAQPPSSPQELQTPPEENVRRPLVKAITRKRTKEDMELIPSPPSAPLNTNKAVEPSPIWAQERPTTHVKAHYSAMEDWNWHWESIPPTLAQKAQANHFFTTYGKSAKLLRSVPLFRLTPESDVPEVAFVGRSNVGKSSLLNAIVNADIKSLLARTSATPGFTKTMNFYGLGPSNGVQIKKHNNHDRIVGRGGLTIVDMPGYGQGSLTSWGVEIMKYIQSRKQLRRVFVLLDISHGLKDKDRSLLASLRLAGVSHQIILSKSDKIYIPPAKEIKRYDGKSLAKLRPKGSLDDLHAQMRKLQPEIQPPVGGGALGEILACSAETMVDGKRLGIDSVRWAILKAAGLDAKAVQKEQLERAEDVQRRLGKEQRNMARRKERGVGLEYVRRVGVHR